jgi:hypothetical protein
MKTRIDCDEKYPFFTLDESNDGPEIELTDEEYADFQRVMDEFYAWQERIDEMGWGPGGVRG